MEFLCCLLAVGGAIWLAVSWSEANKKKAEEQQRQAREEQERQRQQAAVVAQHTAPALPPWRIRDSLRNAQSWLDGVTESARAAYELGAPVPLQEIEGYVEHGWTITTGITRKIEAIQRTHGDNLRALPRRTRKYLERDDESLRRLRDALEALRDDLTDTIAAGGLGDQRRFRELDDNIRAIGDALQQFPR